MRGGFVVTLLNKQTTEGANRGVCHKSGGNCDYTNFVCLEFTKERSRGMREGKREGERGDGQGTSLMLREQKD